MKKLAFSLMLAFAFIGLANAQILQLHKSRIQHVRLGALRDAHLSAPQKNQF